MINKIFFIFVALVITLPSYAGQVTQGGLKVTKVLTGYSNGEAFFVLNNTPLNPNDCSATASSFKTSAIDLAKSDVSQVLSVLLTVFTSGKEVEVQIYDDRCFSSHAVIRRVAVY